MSVRISSLSTRAASSAASRLAVTVAKPDSTTLKLPMAWAEPLVDLLPVPVLEGEGGVEPEVEAGRVVVELDQERRLALLDQRG